MNNHPALTRAGAAIGLLAFSTILFQVACKKKQDEALTAGKLLIKSFTPNEGAPETTVTITGQAFSNTKTDNQVSFNGVPAEVTAVNSNGTELTTRVPGNATTGKIIIKVGDQTATSAADFKVSPTPGSWKILDVAELGDYADHISFAAGDKICVGFGSVSNNNAIYNSQFRIFDLNTKTWSYQNIIPAKVSLRTGATVAQFNNKIYFGGGVFINEGQHNYLDDWWEYDPAKSGDEAWRKTNAKSSIFTGSAAVAKNNLYYFKSGEMHRYTEDNGGTFVGEQYHNVLANMVDGAAYTINDDIYLVGGKNKLSNALYLNVYKYNVASKTFSTLSALPFPTAKVYYSFVLNNQIYAWVKAERLATSSKTFRYNPANDTWTDLQVDANLEDFYNGKNSSAVINGRAFIWNHEGKMAEFIP